MAEGHADEPANGPTATARWATAPRVDDKMRDMYDEFADEHDGEVPSPFTLEAGAARSTSG